MRKTTILALAVALISASSFAAAPVTTEASAVRLPSWVEPASPAAVQAALSKAGLAKASYDRPSVLLQTEYYVYPYTDTDTAQQVTTPTLMLDMDPAGYDEPVSLYLYWQNRETNERFYIANGTILGAGEMMDIFGGNGTPVVAPMFSEFKFFGANSAWGTGPSNPTGMYMFGFEVRNMAGSVISEDFALYSHVDAIVPVTEDILEDTVWTNNNAYYLAKGGADFPVYVGEFSGEGDTPDDCKVTLTIEPGTVVIGSNAELGTLAVQRDGRLIASGTRLLPIIMTGEFTAGNRSAGNWGGLALSGWAQVLSSTGERAGEGESGFFGGDNDADSSGVLSYLRVEYAGIRFNEEDELNGIAFQGTGSGTVVSNIQVNRNADDGVEFFGGATSASNVLITGAEDDSVDWTYGWRGWVNNLVVWQGLANQTDMHGIEADNWSSQPNAEPRAMPIINRATFIGNKEAGENATAIGVKFRRGTGALIRNAIFMGFPGGGVQVDGDETYALIGDKLDVTNTAIFDVTETPFLGDDPATVEAWITDSANGNYLMDPMLVDPLNTLVPNVRPMPGGPADVNGMGGITAGGDWCYQEWVNWAAK
jgi:hypothetical protein